MKKTLIITMVMLGLLCAINTPAYAGYTFSVYTSNGYCPRPTYYHDWQYNPYPNHHYHRSERHYCSIASCDKHMTNITYVTKTKAIKNNSANNKEKLGISDIIVLSNAGISDTNIIQKIKDSGSIFNLSVEEVVALREKGVSSNVINYMLNTNK